MKKCISIIIYFFLFISISYSQKIGVGIEVEASLYQWYKKPTTITGGSSSGQFLALPSVGPKIWFGDWEEYTISIEGKVDYAPFSFNTGEYYGLGALSFPVLIKGNFSPFAPNGNMNGFTKVGIGLGTQWTKTDLYDRPDFLQGEPNPFFITYIAEISCQIVVSKFRKSRDGYSLEFFARGGFGEKKARTFGIGAKFSYRMNFY